MLAAMIEGFKGKWIQLDLQNSNEVNALLTQYQTRIQQLHKKYQHLLVEKGYEKYQGKFEQFRGYNAYQVDLNPEKLQELLSDTDFFVKELEQQAALPAVDEETEGAMETIEQIDLSQDIEISAFQAYLVITNKNKVALVVDSMEIKVKGESLRGEYRFSTEGIWMNFENPNLPEPTHVSILKEKGDTHTVNIDLLDMMKVIGNVEIKAKKSEYAIKFNLALTLSNQSLPEILSLPLKGEWKIKEIKPFTFKEPTDTMSLDDILGGFGLSGLGGMLGAGNEYSYDDYYDDDMMDYDLADYDLEDYELTDEDMQQMMELMKAMNG
ncbi:MAG: hypothetical protein LBI53_03345 [Candidatus Peribacteria bacterium]|jgi:hypothetical protein|nr:hypothetical protein [Candidatus Peribacteria bacterium]